MGQPTPLHVTGWEFGLAVDDSSAAGAHVGNFDAIFNDVTVQGTTKRSGSYALKVKPTATLLAAARFKEDTHGKHWTRFYVLFLTLPTTDMPIYDVRNSASTLRTGIGFNPATGKLRTYVYNGTTFTWDADSTVSISTGVWYRVHYKLEVTLGTPDSIFRSLIVSDETAVETTSGLDVGQLQFVTFGNPVGSLSAAEFYFDDYLLYSELKGFPSPWPLGEGKVVLLRPTGVGTHVNDTKFTDDAANSPPVDPHLRVDEIPVSQASTDYFFQNAIDTTAYIEFTMEDLPISAVSIRGIDVSMGENSPSAANADIVVKFVDVDNANEITSFTIAAHPTHTDVQWVRFNVGTRETVGDPQWTPVGVNAAKIRLGFSGDVTPNVRYHSLYMEVEYAGESKGGWYWGHSLKKWEWRP